MTVDLKTRLKNFALDGENGHVLRTAGDILVPRLGEVLDRFYTYAGSVPELANMFKSDASIAKAKSRQHDHWSMLLNADFSAAYVHSAAAIGKVHFEIQLPFNDYLSSYARASSHLQTMLVEAAGLSVTARSRRNLSEKLGVLTRALSFDTNLVIDSYFSAQQEELNRAFGYLESGIGRMTQRNLAEPIPSPAESDFPQRYDAIRLTFNKALLDVGGSLTKIKSSANEIAAVSSKLHASSGDLAHRTENQAASLEQTAAAMQELTETTRSATEGTQKAENLINNTSKNAEQSRTVVQQAVDKMGEIETASKQISSIISVIEDIAVQTNLLALNAGVEAARAGDAGRGFAVVATEVRGLAQRASEAAKRIDQLINESSRHVGEGAGLVREAGDALHSIIGDVGNVQTVVSEIAASTQEQSQVIQEINTAISHLDRVTQQNAAMVGESNQSNRILQGVASGLTQILSSFRTQPESPQTVIAGDVAFFAPQSPKASTPSARTGTGSWEEF